MWLVLTDRPPTPNPGGGWILRMMNGATPVKVLVTEEAVERASLPDTANRNIFTHRRTFEHLANDKAARHDFEEDGSIVIRPDDMDIRSADWRHA
jgi:hypothetical protein